MDLTLGELTRMGDRERRGPRGEFVLVFHHGDDELSVRASDLDVLVQYRSREVRYRYHEATFSRSPGLALQAATVLDLPTGGTWAQAVMFLGLAMEVIGKRISEAHS